MSVETIFTKRIAFLHISFWISFFRLNPLKGFRWIIFCLDSVGFSRLLSPISEIWNSVFSLMITLDFSLRCLFPSYISYWLSFSTTFMIAKPMNSRHKNLKAWNFGRALTMSSRPPNLIAAVLMIPVEINRKSLYLLRVGAIKLWAVRTNPIPPWTFTRLKSTVNIQPEPSFSVPDFSFKGL